MTITGIGGGTTVQGGATATGAASICSSLSQEACYGLQLSNCNAYGTVGSGGSFVVSGAAAPTGCPRRYYEIGVGVAVGVAALV